MAKVKVELDRAHLAARMARGKAAAGPILARNVLDSSRPFTPHDQGTLEDSGRVEQIGTDYAATWNTVYAAYQYYGCWPDGSHQIKNHDRSINANADIQWAERARERYGKDWQKVAQLEFVRGAG